MLTALLLSLAAAIIPTIFYAFTFYLIDRYEREPIWLVTVAFLWGAVPAVLVSLLGEMLIGGTFIQPPGTIANALITSALIAPIVEEIAKGAALFGLYSWTRREFDDVLDGVIYGALIGFGFAMTENFLYYIGAFHQGGLGDFTLVFFLRSILFGLNHAFYTSLTGIGFGLARNTRVLRARTLQIGGGLLLAIVVHSLHNLGTSLAQVNPLNILISLALAAVGLGVFISVIFLAWYQERYALHSELADEVNILMSAEEYRVLTQEWHRPLRRRRRKIANTDRRMHLFAELALRKQRLRKFGPFREPSLLDEIEAIRAELANCT